MTAAPNCPTTSFGIGRPSPTSTLRAITGSSESWAGRITGFAAAPDRTSASRPASRAAPTPRNTAPRTTAANQAAALLGPAEPPNPPLATRSKYGVSSVANSKVRPATIRIVPAAAPMTREGSRDVVGGAAPMICMPPMFGREVRRGHEQSGLGHSGDRPTHHPEPHPTACARCRGAPLNSVTAGTRPNAGRGTRTVTPVPLPARVPDRDAPSHARAQHPGPEGCRAREPPVGEASGSSCDPFGRRRPARRAPAARVGDAGVRRRREEAQ